MSHAMQMSYWKLQTMNEKILYRLQIESRQRNNPGQRPKCTDRKLKHQARKKLFSHRTKRFKINEQEHKKSESESRW